MKLRSCVSPLLWLGLSAWSAGCGGNVQKESSSRREPEPSGSGATRGGSAASGAEDPDDTPLGSCKLGPSAWDDFDVPCAWIAEDRCYTTRDMACNCACPRSGTSQCVSGFEEGEDGRVWVACE